MQLCSQRRSPPPTGLSSSATPTATPSPPRRSTRRWRRAWTYEAPGGVDSTAIIVDGVVYFGEMDGRFHAVDLETGEARWVYQANLGVPASGCVSGGAVFFGDEDGYFHAVDIETGKKRWVFEGFAEFLSSPICLDDAVLVGSYDANLYAFDPASGAVKWKYATDDRVNSSPAVVAGKTFITGCDGKFRIIDVASGEEDSFVDMQDYVAASPSVVGNLAYVGTFGNEVLAMDWKKGEILWRYHHPQTHFEFFASPGGQRRPGRHRRARQESACHRPADGRARMGVHHPLPRRFLARPGRRRHLGRLDGRQPLRPQSRRRRAAMEIHARRPRRRLAAISGDRLVIGSRSGEVFCFRK